jgi:N-formylglutamate deformylase
MVSLPHDGSEIPAEIAAHMHPAARRSPDTDWQVSHLYDVARELGAHVLRPRWSRYVVDLNRPPDGAALYPGRRETGLCPTVMFTGEPVYLADREPDARAVAERVDHYWRPYHQCLATTLDAILSTHGRALLWEGHSIRSQCPMFFEGRLPDYNIGTADGASCATTVEQAIADVLGRMPVSHVINGRFKGGYITRRYGQPQRGISAVQMEMAQASYLDEADPERFDPLLAAPAQAVLRGLLTAAVAAL